MPQLFTSQKELEEFAACFSVNRNHKDVRNKIKDLPENLRYSKRDLLLHKSGYKENKRYNHIDRPSCSIHRWIDSIAVSAIFDSLRTELDIAVERIGKHLDALGPDETLTLHRVAVIREMWTRSWPDTIHNDRWEYQADQCEACMLSRIAKYPSALRELRTLFLAHPEIRLYQPIIFTFVDEWIMLTDQAKTLFDTSEERAEEIKDCVDPRRLHKKLKAAEEEEKRKQQTHQQHSQNAEGLETLPALSYNPTPPLAQDTPSPLFSSTLTRPLSRNGHEFSEAEFLQEFSPNNETFYRTSSTESNDGSSDTTEINSSDHDARASLNLSKTLAVLQKQQIIDQYGDGGVHNGERNSNPGMSSRLYSPWSSTDEIRGSFSRFSQTTVSSPSYSVQHHNDSPPISPINEPGPRTPDRYRTPVSPLANPTTPMRYMPPPKTPKTPDNKSRMLLPIPEVSPFHISPFVSSSASRSIRPSSSRVHTSAVSPERSQISLFSRPGGEGVGTELLMSRGQGRVVHVRNARKEERYTSK